MSFAKDMFFFDLLIYAGFPHLLCLPTFASLEALAERFCLTCVCVYDLFKCYLLSLALPLSRIYFHRSPWFDFHLFESKQMPKLATLTL